MRGRGSRARIIACEVETAASFSRALAAGAPTQIQPTPSFVDGIGGAGVLEEMWPLARRLLDGAIAVSVREIVDAVRMLAERARIVAEGAGAAPVAAALSGRGGLIPGSKVVAVVSGGNLDLAKLAAILRGEIP
jgi:threonine dehydratase